MQPKIVVFLVASALLIGSSATHLVMQPIIDRLKTDNAKLAAQITECHEEKAAMADAARSLMVTYGQIANVNRETFSEATVLYEPVPPPSQTTQAIELLATIAGHPIPRVEGMRPRWFIPAKIKPTVYGDPRGMQILYVDSQGRKEGPFAPEILPQ